MARNSLKLPKIVYTSTLSEEEEASLNAEGSSSRGDGGWPGIRYFRFLIANSVDCCIATNVFNGPKTGWSVGLLFLCHLVMGLRIDANPYFAQRTQPKLGAPSSVFRNAPLETYPANPKQCHTYVEHSKIEVLSKNQKKNS